MIRDAINSGMLAVGDSLPSVQEMSARQDVRVATLQHALVVLAEEGLVVLRQGALILFIRNRRNITQIIENASLYVTKHPSFIQAIEPQDPAKRRDYLMRADSDEKRIIRMSLLPVVIPRLR